VNPVAALSPETFLLVLNFKLAFAATLATMLVRFRWFRRILLTEKRDWRERLTFAAWLGTPLVLGMAARVSLHYDAADLTLAGPFLAGLIAGPYAGAIVGAAMGVPPLFIGEYGTLAFAVGCGFAGGGLREICPKDEIWRFSPFVVTRLARSAWRLIRHIALEWQLILVMAPVLLEVLRQAIARHFPTGIANLHQQTEHWWLHLLEVVTAVLAVAIPIKIWNSARIEHRLSEQEQLLLASRVEALANQINPHFLFNTLNSIKSLIRSRPDTAREVLDKLSNLLRRLLSSQDHFVKLRDELAAVAEYLDIERVRFGPTLVVEHDIDPTSLDVVVPSMILQPLVENSIKHGLSRKVGEGRITIRSARRAGHVVLEVVDNGVGIPEHRREGPEHHGIGLSNVNERLRVIYGANYQLKLHSIPGQGTSARVEIPEITVAERATA
jgi:two-component system LytT family sensor kinase